MAAVSVQEQAQALLERQIAGLRSSGAMNPSDETLVVMETIGTALVMNPKAVLYLMHLARNQLLSLATGELAQVAVVQKTIQDLDNRATKAVDSQDLVKAQEALVQLEEQRNLSVNSTQFARFNASISSFLDKQLRSTVAPTQSSSLIRPAPEALRDLPTDMQELGGLHAELVSRLYSLDTGVANFLEIPFSSILGRITSSRMRLDLQDMIDTISADPNTPTTQDMAVRLLTARAALKLLGTEVDLTTPLVDTVSKLPEGYELRGRSPEVACVLDGLSGPYVMPAAAQLTVQDQTSSVSFTFPLTTTDLGNRPAILGTPITFPITVPAGMHLFLRIQWTGPSVPVGPEWVKSEGRYSKTVRVILNDNAEGGLDRVMTVADFISAVSATGIVTAVEHPIPALTPATVLLYVASSDYDRISVAPLHQEEIIDIPSGVPVLSSWSNSAHTLFGFQQGQAGVSGSTGSDVILRAFNVLFGDKVALSQVPNPAGGHLLRATGAAVAPGAFLNISGTAASPLGLLQSKYASSPKVFLYGRVLGVEYEVVDPVPLLDIGDYVYLTADAGIVSTLDDAAITLASPVITFDGPITIHSSALQAWDNLTVLVHDFVSSFSVRAFAKDLSKINSLVSSFTLATTLSKRKEALYLLGTLQGFLQDLIDRLSTPNTYPNPNGVTTEKQTISSIVNTLTERKYDRALDFFLQGKIIDLFTMDSESVSFGGNFLKSLSAVAAQDLLFPNASLGQGTSPISSQPLPRAPSRIS